MNPKQFHDAACRIAGRGLSVRSNVERWKHNFNAANSRPVYGLSVLHPTGTRVKQCESHSAVSCLKQFKVLVQSFKDEATHA